MKLYKKGDKLSFKVTFKVVNMFHIKDSIYYIFKNQSKKLRSPEYMIHSEDDITDQAMEIFERLTDE